MEESGEVMHLAKSGRLIVKLGTAGKETKSGELLVDENGKRIGKVIEVIGSTAAPYASVIPQTDRTNKITGIKVFSGGFLPKRRPSKRSDYKKGGFGRNRKAGVNQL
jgi:rRNA processing protein Gar1